MLDIFDYKNQNYHGKCLECENMFAGRKGDRTCRPCSDANMLNSISELNKQVKVLLDRNTKLESTLANVLISNRYGSTIGKE